MPLLQNFCETGILKKALTKKLLKIRLVDYRYFGIGKHKKVDERPFGGGAGMLIRPEPVVKALESLSPEERGVVFMLTPKGEAFTQAKARQLARLSAFSLVCGRYEGFDQRVESFVDEQISLGPFVLMGGEVAAMAIVESVSRHIPKVLGNLESAADESFSENNLEYPQYTKPVEFRGMTVPEVLRSGDHKKIMDWKKKNQIIIAGD